MDIYDELGVRKVINGIATVTVLGGSIMPPEVVMAMISASRNFVSIDDLQKKAGEKIAEWTQNESAFICCGAAAGLALSTAACITGTDHAKCSRLPFTEGMKNEVIIHKLNRNGYDFAIRQVGTKIVEIGTEAGTTPEDMENAINEKTAAIFYFYNISRMGGLVPLEKAIEIAKRKKVPLIVDAAAQIPPVENLWRFTRMGADLAIFSGGKGLCGPQSSGLIVGRKDLIEACALNANPRCYIGRPMKVGKEEIVGLLTAIRWYLNLDHKKLMQTYEDQVQYIIDEFSNNPYVTAKRNFPSEAGQPMPRAEIIFDENSLGISCDKIMAQLRNGEPSIELARAGANSIFVNPQTLSIGQEKIIVKRIKEIISNPMNNEK
ncbi:TPA: aminotransferase class V-fold PLP-dependent enzyme [Candidatus Poribacteria bacterium]|nr:aminotransferase class V-fold PLP-dependent enzyme [Candidatus Poribacteria bacterium]